MFVCLSCQFIGYHEDVLVVLIVEVLGKWCHVLWNQFGIGEIYLMVGFVEVFVEFWVYGQWTWFVGGKIVDVGHDQVRIGLREEFVDLQRIVTGKQIGRAHV